MALLDVLGRRWPLRIGWELRDDSALSFRELRSRCDSMSASVLAERLAELREAGIVELNDGGYRLTKPGQELLQAKSRHCDSCFRDDARVGGGSAHGLRSEHPDDDGV
jgi:DNA-binding HxlR family transcriptional regulator